MILPPTHSATQRLARQNTAGTLPPEFTMSRPVFNVVLLSSGCLFSPQSLSLSLCMCCPGSLSHTLYGGRWHISAHLSASWSPLIGGTPAGPLPWRPLWLRVSPLSMLHDIDLWHWAACLDWSGRLEWDAVYTWVLLLLLAQIKEYTGRWILLQNAFANHWLVGLRTHSMQFNRLIQLKSKGKAWKEIKPHKNIVQYFVTN